MALDPSIALGVKPLELPNQLAQYGQVQQIQANQMKMQEAQAANEERNALRQLNPANADYENQLFKVNPQLGIQYRKERTAAEASTAATAQHKMTAADTRQKMDSQAWRDISNRPSDANIIAHTEDVQDSALHSPQEKQIVAKRAQMLLDMPFAERKTFLEAQGATASDYSSRANNAATVGATIRGQNLVDARAREREARLAQGSMGTGLSVEQNDALYGENGAVARGLVNPNRIKSVATAKMYADTFIRNPNANPVKIGQEVAASDAAFKSFMGDGKAAQKVESANTAIGHLQSLKDLYAAQQNGDARAFNAAANAISSQFGGAAPTNLQMAVQIVGPEIAKSVIGTSGSMREREEFVSGLSGKAASPAQFAGAIDTTTGLLTTRLGEVENSYKRQTKRDDFRSTFLNPTSRAILDKASATVAPAANVPAIKFLGFEPSPAQ